MEGRIKREKEYFLPPLDLYQAAALQESDKRRIRPLHLALRTAFSKAFFAETKKAVRCGYIYGIHGMIATLKR